MTDLITLITTVGGVQGIAEAVKWWHSRRLRRREDEAGSAPSKMKTSANRPTGSKLASQNATAKSTAYMPNYAPSRRAASRRSVCATKWK